MRLHLGAIVLGLACTAAQATAHTSLVTASPASGSVLTASPPAIVLTFHEPTRVASATVATASTPARRLNVSPRSATRVVTLAAPRLGLGRNEVRWRALSADGHVVEGLVILVLRPAPAP